MPTPAPPTAPIDPHLVVALLAQGGRGPGVAAAGRVFFWCAVLVAAALLLALAAWWLRRTLAASNDEEPMPMGFSLADLRTMHARGQLTDEEFAHAKGRMVARTRAAMNPTDTDATSTAAVNPDATETANATDGYHFKVEPVADATEPPTAPPPAKPDAGGPEATPSDRPSP